LLHCGDDFAFQNPHNGTRIASRPVERREGGGVLNNLSEQIRECLQHAEECARKAAVQTDPAVRGDFLGLEKRYRELARSIEFGERLKSFTKNSAKPNIKPNV
jgi:hypothetical protein